MVPLQRLKARWKVLASEKPEQKGDLRNGDLALVQVTHREVATEHVEQAR